MRMEKQHKWYLSKEKCVEDELFAFGLQSSELHPELSFIMDPTNTNYMKYDVFSQNFDKDYDYSTFYDYDWVRITVYRLLREYDAGILKKTSQ
jgi:hypothetical protein